MNYTLKNKLLILALSSSAYTNLAHANEAHICTSTSIPVNLELTGDVRLSDQTKFECPGIGEVTIPQLAKSGWKIGFPVEQASKNSVFWQILIQN